MSQASSDRESTIEEDISPLEYARQNGLATDYKNDPVRAYSNVCNIIREDAKRDLFLEEELPEFDFGPSFVIKERLPLTKEAAVAIGEASRSDAQNLNDIAVSSLLDNRRAKKLKLELPLLEDDEEYTFTEYKQALISDDFEIPYSKIIIPAETVNDENDEGMGWPSRYYKVGPSWIKEVRTEKLHVGSDIMYFLQNHPSKITLSAEEDEKLWSSLLACCKVGRDFNSNLFVLVLISDQRENPRHHTPPLMPLSPCRRPEPPSPEASAYEIPLLSDSSTFDREERERLEQHIMQQDVPTPVRDQSHTHADLLTLIGAETHDLPWLDQQFDEMEKPLLPILEEERLRVNQLKAEVPLTPSDPPQREDEKTVAWAPYADAITLPDEMTSSPNVSRGMQHLAEILDTSRKKVLNKIRYGEGVSADALSRVAVPELSPLETVAPWKKLLDDDGENGFQFAYERFIKQNIINSGVIIAPYSGMKFLRDSVPWTFFRPSLSDPITNENFPRDDAVWKSFIDESGNVMDSTSQTWKPPGLRILDPEEDDDDELEYDRFIKEGPEDMATLLKKRKLQMEQDDGRSSRQSNRSNIGAGSTGNERNYSQNGPPGNLLGGPFSAGLSVDNFMEMRGAKKAKLGQSEFFSARTTTPVQMAAKGVKSQESAKESVVHKKVNILPAPSFEIPRDAFSIIVSTKTLEGNSMLKILERTFPSITVIERDFRAHNTTKWLPGSVQVSPVKSHLDTEADILVSPAMGIIITTLVKARSAPLPGHKGKSEIRERIEKVSVRYEKLIILVGGGEESASVGATGLCPSDISGLADFVGFTTGLDCAITVQYVAGGSRSLYQWLMAAIAQNRVPETLLAEQTHWELFLRRAGLNAFAAQSVLSLLRPPDGTDPSNPSKMGQFGLTAFVEMGRHMRIARFAPHCGRRVLERVSEVVDVRWA